MTAYAGFPQGLPVEAVALRRNLTLLVWGIPVVFLDLSFNGFDVLYDSVGYLLAAFGLAGVRAAVDDDAVRARALVALVLSALAAAVYPIPGAGAGEAMLVLATLQPVAVAYALLRVAAVLSARAAEQAWLVTVALLAVGALVVLVAVATGNVGPATGVVAALIGIGVMVVFVVALVRTRAAVPKAP